MATMSPLLTLASCAAHVTGLLAPSLVRGLAQASVCTLHPLQLTNHIRQRHFETPSPSHCLSISNHSGWMLIELDVQNNPIPKLREICRSQEPLLHTRTAKLGCKPRAPSSCWTTAPVDFPSTQPFA